MTAHRLGEWCGPAGPHLLTVVYTRPWRAWFRKRYVVRCWECEIRLDDRGGRVR